MQKWEYKVVEFVEEIEVERKKTARLPRHWFPSASIDDLLNKYGSQGWELVNVQTLYNAKEIVMIGFFKRVKT